MYEHANSLAKTPSAFATSPPLISSSPHILTTLSQTVVAAPAVQVASALRTRIISLFVQVDFQIISPYYD
ncbi:hypothetical protein CFP56_032265 [Quercus suber]|uniref:Uncharacterized protein n=1 Tax=Quercus suber TaxID=58331 RepID=A0AAW0LSI3_QUESU